MSRSTVAAVRSIHGRALRAQRAYTQRLREVRDALAPLIDENEAEALALARAIDAELAHIAYGSALVDD